jgi:dCMP deaminase
MRRLGKEGRGRPVSRPGIDEYFMMMAEVTALRSSWGGTKVGCVATVDGMVRSTGYNGTPKGWTNDLEKNKDNLRFFCHAEENAIVQAARAGVSLEGAVFYTTMSPCLTCARMIRNVGATMVVYGEAWDEPEGAMALEMLAKLGLTTQQEQKREDKGAS